MRGTLSSALGRAVNGVLALALAFSVNVAPLAAAEPPPPSAQKAPKVEKELVADRTESSKTYLLADGTLRSDFYAQPIHYRDKDGSFKPADASLVETTVSGRSVAVNKANKFRLELPKNLGNDTIKLELDGSAVTMRPAWHGLADEATTANASSRAESERVREYRDAFKDTTVEYESRTSGLKESIVISKPSSATVYSFDLGLKDLTPQLQADGSITLSSAESTSPLLTMPAPAMWDSAETSEAAFTNDVRYELSGAGNAWRLDVVADPEWLNDPARVYPVTIDPTFLTTTATPADTYISSLAERQGINYSSSTSLYVNNHHPNADFTEYSLLQPGPIFMSDLADKKSQGYDVFTADLRVVVRTVLGAGSIRGQRCSGAVNIGTVTWATKPALGSPISSTEANASGNHANHFDITDIVSYWQDAGNSASYATIQLQMLTSGGRICYKSAQDSGTTPLYTVNYAKPPTVTLTEPTTSTVDPTATWTYTEAQSNPQDVYELSLYTFDGSNYQLVTSRTETSSATTATLPAPAGGFSFGTTYYAQVRSRATTGLWSALSAMGPYTPQALGTPATVSVQTTASAGWFAESDANSDGVADAGNDTSDQGRGSVSMTWTPVPGASSYRIYLHDGYAYRQVASTTATSWSSAGKGLFPADSQVSSLSAETTSNPFLSGTGKDLRDDPRALYAKTAGTSMDATPAYLFKVSAVNGLGEAPSGTSATATLENRTVRAGAEPQHTDYPLGEMLDHDVVARLDKGSVEIDFTDLEIASWGPRAALSRHYSSDSTASTLFAPGWRFGFESSLAVSGTVATWTDEAGERHTFVYTAGAWKPPHGSRYVLTSTGAGWRITFVGGDHVDFNASGVLVSESDANGNTVTYVRLGSSLWIIAPNSQYIDVALDVVGRPTSATYGTSDGTRAVSYTSPLASGSATVTLNVGTADELPLSYSYHSEQLTWIVGPETELSSSYGPYSAWALSYESGRISQTQALQWPLYLTRFECGQGEATVTVNRHSVEGQGFNEDAVQRFEFNPDGTESRRSDVRNSGIDGLPIPEDDFAYETRVYDPNARLVESRDLAGGVVTSAYDSRGNLVRQVDAAGGVTTYVYDSSDRAIREVDPLGSETSRTLDVSGNVLVEEQVLNAAGDKSRVERSFNASGAVTQERVKLSATDWATTDYSAFAFNGEAQSVTSQDVSLSVDVARDLTATKHYDSFGNLIWEKDASGVWVVKENTYSISGRLLTSEVLSGTVTKNRYDALGHQIEASTTAQGQVTGWVQTSKDIRDAVIAVCRIDRDGDLQSGSLVDLDPSGIEKWSAAPGLTLGVGSEAGISQAFDAAGRTVRTWAPGATRSDDASATRIKYDTAGRERARLEPGASASQATTTTYDVAGRATRVDSPDDTWVEYDYDAAGNVTRETKSADAGPTDSAKLYDLAGRLVARTDETSRTTTFAYDLSGRQVGAAIEGQTGSGTTYNSLGWKIAETDGDGVVTKTSYDAAGRVTEKRVADKATTSVYDAAGRLIETLEPDGRKTTTVYDAFGRMVEESQTVAGAPVRHKTVSYDEHNRATGVTETIGAVVRSTSFVNRSDVVAASSASYAGVTSSATHDQSAGLLSSESVNATATSLTRSVTRDAQGRVTGQSVTGLAPRSLAYDGAGHLTSASGPGLGAAGESYVYGDAGLKNSEHVALAWPTSIDATYTYTPDGRLKTWTSPLGTSAYAFDDDGNLTAIGSQGTTTTLTYSGDRLIAMGSTAYGWDTSHGWRTSSKRSGEASATFGFTDSGRLLAFSDPARSVSATYTYDGQGQRTRSVVTSAGVTTTTDFLYDGLTLLSLSASRSDGATWTISYLANEAGQPYAALYSDASLASPLLVHLVTTDRGDVVSLLSASGTTFGGYTYDPWGNSLGATWRGVDSTITTSVAAVVAERQPLRYAGYAYDSHSGLYYCSQRYYDPATRQFITKDPARDDGEESAYQYTGGEPAGNTDPTGLKVLPVPTNGQGTKKNWCWVAASVAVLKYKKKAVTNEAFYTYVKGCHGGSDQTGTISEMKRGIEHYLGRSISTKEGILTLPGVKSQIDHGWPVIARKEWSDGPVTAHMVVIMGYKGSSLSIMDPGGSGSTYWQAYSKLVNTKNVHKWTHTLFDIGK